jgi:hypothetical protein
MIDGGMKASRRHDKEEVDKISAAIILQGWLDRRNGGGTSFAAGNVSVPENLSSSRGRSGGQRKKGKR